MSGYFVCEREDDCYEVYFSHPNGEDLVSSHETEEDAESAIAELLKEERLKTLRTKYGGKR